MALPTKELNQIKHYSIALRENETIIRVHQYVTPIRSLIFVTSNTSVHLIESKLALNRVKYLGFYSVQELINKSIPIVNSIFSDNFMILQFQTGNVLFYIKPISLDVHKLHEFPPGHIMFADNDTIIQYSNYYQVLPFIIY